MAATQALQKRIKAESEAVREKYGLVAADVIENGLIVLYGFFQQVAGTYGMGTTVMLFTALAEIEARVADETFAGHIKIGKEVGEMYAKLQTDFKALLGEKEEVSGYE